MLQASDEIRQIVWHIPDNADRRDHIIVWEFISDPHHILHMPALEQDWRVRVWLLIIQGGDADPEARSILFPTDLELWIPAPVINLDLTWSDLKRPFDQFHWNSHRSSI